MKEGRAIQLRAVHHGAVIDYNLFGVPEQVCNDIMQEIAAVDEDAFCHSRKAAVQAVDVRQRGDKCTLTIIANDRGKVCVYELSEIVLRQSIGGLAYNVLQNLNSLEQALSRGIKVDALIGVPKGFWREGEARGFVDAQPRKSVILRTHDGQELNIVSDECRLLGFPSQGRASVASIILSSHSVREYEEEIQFCLAEKARNPALAVYFSPGSTQIKKGIAPLLSVLAFTKLIVMRLDEARRFLAIMPHYGSRDELARHCMARFLEHGVYATVLNDSENGSYCATPNELFHVPPYAGLIPSQLKMEDQFGNFSGCGDSIFASLVYGFSTDLEADVESEVLFATAIARVIALRYDSNLQDASPEGLRELQRLCSSTRIAFRHLS